jgi:hypothetical protein
MCNQCKKAMLMKVENNARLEQERRMKDLVHKSMTVMTPKIAGEIRSAYEGGVKDFNVNMKPVLENGFGMNASDAYDFLASSEKSVYEFA